MEVERTNTLTMRDGSTVDVPMRRHEKETHGRPQIVWTTDFSALSGDRGGPYICPRCEGAPNRETGMIGPSYSGLIVGYVGWKRNQDTRKRENLEHWRRIAAACDCVFGAWRVKAQRFPWFDDYGSPVLSSEEWTMLALASPKGIVTTESVKAYIDRKEAPTDTQQEKEVLIRNTSGPDMKTGAGESPEASAPSDEELPF